MVSVGCNVCGGSEHVRLLDKNGYTVVRCSGCGLVFVNPQPDEEELARLYSFESNYHVGHLDEKKENRLGKRSRKKLAFLKRNGISEGLLLDVGCSTGFFLKEAGKAGFTPRGVELNPDTSRLAETKYGLDVENCRIEDLDPAKGPFDVITFLDSLEHMLDPRGALESANGLLADGGYALVTLPNVAGLFPTLTYALFTRPFGVWSHPAPPGHLYDFSPATMTHLLERTGYKVVDVLFEGQTLAYTVSKFSESMVTLMRGNPPAKRPPATPKAAVKGDVAAKPPAGAFPGNKKALRWVVKCVSYAFVSSIYLAASLLNRGDSMMILAKKTGVPG